MKLENTDKKCDGRKWSDMQCSFSFLFIHWQWDFLFANCHQSEFQWEIYAGVTNNWGVFLAIIDDTSQYCCNSSVWLKTLIFFFFQFPAERKKKRKKRASFQTCSKTTVTETTSISVIYKFSLPHSVFFPFQAGFHATHFFHRFFY